MQSSVKAKRKGASALTGAHWRLLDHNLWGESSLSFSQHKFNCSCQILLLAPDSDQMTFHHWRTIWKNYEGCTNLQWWSCLHIDSVCHYWSQDVFSSINIDYEWVLRKQNVVKNKTHNQLFHIHYNSANQNVFRSLTIKSIISNDHITLQSTSHGEIWQDRKTKKVTQIKCTISE